MFRSTLAAIAGIVAGGAGVAVIQFLSHRINPPPPGLDLNNPKDVAVMMEQISLGALLGVELSYLVGSLVAGVLVGMLAGNRSAIVALVVGGVFTVFNVINLVSIPHRFEIPS